MTLLTKFSAACGLFLPKRVTASVFTFTHLIQRHFLVPASLSPVVNRRIRGDLIQPSLEIIALQGVGLFMDPRKRLLKQILRPTPIRRHPTQIPQQTIPVSAHQLGKRRLLAPAMGINQAFIGTVHQRLFTCLSVFDNYTRPVVDKKK